MKKKRQKHSFLFENIILFSPFSILFQTRKNFFANKNLENWSFLKRKTLPCFKKWISLETKHFEIFFHQVFLPSFSHHFLFLFISFRIHLLFHFLLCLTFHFLDYQFFSNTISPSCVSQNIQLIPFWMRALPLYVLLLMDLFICCLFFSLRFFSFLTHLFPFSLSLLSITSLKDKFMELLQSKKKLVCLFPFCFFHIYLSLQFVCFFDFFVLFSCVFEHSSF